MKRQLLLTIGSLVLACAAPASASLAQAAATADSAEDRQRWLSDYLTAFNTGEVDALGASLDDLYSDTFAREFGGEEAAAAMRLETFRTAGPLELAAVPPTQDPPIVWTRGTISGAWIGHQVELNASGAAERHTIWRVRPPGAPELAKAPAEELAAEVRSYFERMAAAGLFSGSVELRRGTALLLSEAFGTRDRVGDARVTKATPFDIASVTKLLSSIAILKAVEKGALSLGDPVRKWVPEYPEPAASRTTLRHLLTHTAGIAFDDDPLYVEEASEARTASDLLQAQIGAAGRTGFPFEFGAYKYSSEQIDLAAIMLERATGRPWTEAVRDHVLIPAGMTDTSFTPPPGRAVGYTSSTPGLQGNAAELRSSLALIPPHAKPSSHVWSTAQDLARAMSALVEGKLLGPEMTRALLEPQQQGEQFPLFQLSSWAGLGSQGADDYGVRTVGHGGVFPGYSAVIEYFPATGHLLTIVSNTGEHSAYIAYQRVLEMIYGVPAPAS